MWAKHNYKQTHIAMTHMFARLIACTLFCSPEHRLYFSWWFKDVVHKCHCYEGSSKNVGLSENRCLKSGRNLWIKLYNRVIKEFLSQIQSTKKKTKFKQDSLMVKNFCSICLKLINSSSEISSLYKLLEIKFWKSFCVVFPRLTSLIHSLVFPKNDYLHRELHGWIRKMVVQFDSNSIVFVLALNLFFFSLDIPIKAKT